MSTRCAKRLQMCEEIKNASTVVPWTMIGSLAINGVLAFAMLIAVLFCMGDITAAVKSPTGYPFIEIFTQTTGSKAGATVMTSIVAVLVFFGIITALAGSSRMTWSFSRDRGLPGWRYLSKVSHRQPCAEEMRVATSYCTGRILNDCSLMFGFRSTHALPLP